jgi:hypothetical protein
MIGSLSDAFNYCLVWFRFLDFATSFDLNTEHHWEVCIQLRGPCFVSLPSLFFCAFEHLPFDFSFLNGCFHPKFMKAAIEDPVLRNRKWSGGFAETIRKDEKKGEEISKILFAS